MRTYDKVRGVLATAGLTYEEFGQLCGVTRRTIHGYLSGKVYMEDMENGVKCMAMADKLMGLCTAGSMPLSHGVPKESRVATIKSLLS